MSTGSLPVKSTKGVARDVFDTYATPSALSTMSLTLRMPGATHGRVLGTFNHRLNLSSASSSSFFKFFLLFYFIKK